MENNEITMYMDVKIDKRPECIRYQQWIRSQVKIEAVKCLPCFLRITLSETSDESEQQNLSLCINVPGVSITLATSRTKQHSYALCWTQNRKFCCIYFALDTELSCRRHMKWVKKSIKNLELHRKILLEERRCSKAGPIAFSHPQPTIDDFNDDSAMSQRVSEIYEEIYEPQSISQLAQDSRRVSRRSSRTSIASGIYEEMKFPSDLQHNFDAIIEELTTPVPPIPPPLPPLPPLRKRFNTYETEEIPTSPLNEVPIMRSNTNPESDMAKKKKYKNIMETIFHGNGLRSKRTVNTSESCQEQLANTAPKQSKTKVKSTETKSPKLNSPTLPNFEPAPIYANDDTTAPKRQKKPEQCEMKLGPVQSKRNSFSSPDLSKINFLDTFDEQRIADMMNPSFLKCDDLDLANWTSLDESVLLPVKTGRISKLLDRQNISTRLPQNFNFSACNTSSINLIAPLSSQQQRLQQPTKNEIIHDDLTGYCVMAPIVPKMSAIDNTLLAAVVKPLESVSSGYSTGSYTSPASSAEEQRATTAECIDDEESDVYMNMQEPATLREIATPPQFAVDFTGNLYENLLAIKAARELELEPNKCATTLSTSTPTESPLLQVEVSAKTSTTTPTSTKIIITTVNKDGEEEDYYQIPRKSIISIDEKIPSYYPNTCETNAKSRRRSYSPTKVYNKTVDIEKTPTSSTAKKSPETPHSASSSKSGLRQLVSLKLRCERKENLYLTSPQCIIEQRKAITISNTAAAPSMKTPKSKKTAAHKISENVYAVKHRLKKSIMTDTKNLESYKSSHNNNNNILVESMKNNETVGKQSDVLENLAILQNIDFKFEDAKVLELEQLQSPTKTNRLPLSPTHHLQVNQSSNTCHKLKGGSNTPTVTKTNLVHMTQSAITTSGGCKTDAVPDVVACDANSPTSSGVKKFASLPRFKKFDLSPLRLRIHNVLQRNHTPDL